MAGNRRRFRALGRTGRRDWLWVVTLAVVLAAAGLAVALVFFDGSDGGGPAIDGIACERSERLEYHVHAHLALFVEGRSAEVPAEVGISRSCIYWLHTHDARGLIHIEAPAEREFRLGQFFRVWGQPLSSAQLLDRSADAEHEVRAFVNGQPFDGDPSEIVLADRTSIVVQYGPPFVPLPPPFQFR